MMHSYLLKPIVRRLCGIMLISQSPTWELKRKAWGANIGIPRSNSTGNGSDDFPETGCIPQREASKSFRKNGALPFGGYNPAATPSALSP